MAEKENPEEISVTVKWSGKEYVVDAISQDLKVADLKGKIYALTGVKPERQKLLGLKCKGEVWIHSVHLFFFVSINSMNFIEFYCCMLFSNSLKLIPNLAF